MFFSTTLVGLGCGTSSGETGDGTDSGSESDTGGETDDSAGTDGNAFELGDHASPACVEAMQQLPDLLAATAAVSEASADASAIEAAYSGTALQTYVQQLDTINGRSDDTNIAAALQSGTPADLIDVETLVMHALIEGLRTNVAAPEAAVTDPFTTWDDANCVWEGALRSAAQAAEGWGGDYSDDIVSVVEAAFRDGHAGLIGEPEAASIDDWTVPPNKQRVEKNQYRIIHRHVIHYATLARDNADALSARRALGWFQIFAHRLEEKNTAGIATIEGILTGSPDAIDPAAIVRELNIAFARRTHKYCYNAVEAGEVGVPSGYKGAVEGSTYTLLLYPDMVANLSGFDAAAYDSEWATYVEAVRNDDLETATSASEQLLAVNCQYQTEVLGLSTCGDSE